MYGHPFPIHLAGNCSSKNVRTMFAKCDGAHLIFSCAGLLRTKSTGHQFLLWHIYKKNDAVNSVTSTAVGQTVACAPVTQRARVLSPVETSFLGEVFSEFFLTCKKYRLNISRVTNGSNAEIYGT